MSGPKFLPWSGKPEDYISVSKPADDDFGLLRLFFQLGRESGLAEAEASRAGYETAVEERVRQQRECSEFYDALADGVLDRYEASKHQPAVSTPNMTVYVDPNADAEAVAKDVSQLWTTQYTPDPQPSKEPEMAVALPKPAKSPGRLKHGSHLVGDHTTVTYTKEQEKHRPGRIGDVVMVTAAGRQVEIRLTPSGRKAKVYVDGTEIQSA